MRTVLDLLKPRLWPLLHRRPAGSTRQYVRLAVVTTVAGALWIGVFMVSLRVLTHFSTIEQIGALLNYKLLNMLMVTSLASVAIWLPVMVLTPSEDESTLRSFYARVRPAEQVILAGIKITGTLLGQLQRHLEGGAVAEAAADHGADGEVAIGDRRRHVGGQGDGADDRNRRLHIGVDRR